MAKFIKQLLSSSGDVSFARVMGAIVIFYLLFYDIWIVFNTKAIADIPANFLVLVLALYGMSKTGDVISAKGSQNAIPPGD